MMMGGGVRKHVFDLLSDAEKFKSYIEDLTRATEARNQSAEDHKQAKIDAEQKIQELNQAKLAHEDRENQLNTKNAEIEGLKQHLNGQIEEFNRKIAEISQEKSIFEANKTSFQQSVAQTLDAHEAIDKSLKSRKSQLDMQEAELEKRYTQLIQREGWVADAKADIRDFASKLISK